MSNIALLRMWTAATLQASDPAGAGSGGREVNPMEPKSERVL
jgi:hypothetical protein